jgi:multimeric flavodoxin WrbA
MPESRLLGIVASHRRGGNSEIVFKDVAGQMKEWRLSLIRLPQLSILPCKGCCACLRPGVQCNLDDDNELKIKQEST